MSEILSEIDEHGFPPTVYTYTATELGGCRECDACIRPGDTVRRIGRNDSPYANHTICTTCWEGMQQ